jgi:siroheme synthase
MSDTTITLDTIDPQVLEALLAQVAERKKAEREANKAQREANKALRAKTSAFCTNLVKVIREQFGDPRVFTSGATGWSVSADTSDGYRVSILVREIATIPAKTE